MTDTTDDDRDKRAIAGSTDYESTDQAERIRRIRAKAKEALRDDTDDDEE